MNVKSLIASFAVASASELMSAGDYQFFDFVATYGRSYGTKAEFEFRSAIFKNNLAAIEEHNSTDGQTSTVGVNFMSDWTTEEKKKLTGTFEKKTVQENVVILDETAVPASVDWTTKGAVTPVKNQGQCGSCWAFSTTGSVEGAMFLKSGSLQSYSEQQLVDCSTQNSGCQGGLMDYAFKYIESNPLMLESDYQYTASQGKCKYEKSKGEGQVKSFKDVSSGSASQLKAAVAQQPVSVAIEADQQAFQGYTGGVITKGCGSQLDHGVLAVGYGTDNGQDYFLVKNSWGPSWGVKGYVKIAPNQCGIVNQPSYPTE